MSGKNKKCKLHLNGRRVDDKRIEVGGVFFYESSKSIAIKKYANTHKKRNK